MLQDCKFKLFCLTGPNILRRFLLATRIFTQFTEAFARHSNPNNFQMLAIQICIGFKDCDFNLDSAWILFSIRITIWMEQKYEYFSNTNTDCDSNSMPC